MSVTPARYRVLKQAKREKRARPGTIVYACIHPDYSVVNLQKHKALYRDAGQGASSHSGRRTLITGLAERGIDLKAIALIAGHASIRTTAEYVEANSARLAKILKEVSW